MKNPPQKADTFMSITERFNLHWITRAITVSERCELERYYYDIRNNELCSVIKLPDYSSTVMVLDKFGVRYDYEKECDLTVRLELINHDDAGIIELPHLTVADKVSLQKQFLSTLSYGTYQHKYIKAINLQTESQGFVLDSLLYLDNQSAWLIPHWEYMKSQIAFTYLNWLTYFKGISIDLTN